MNIELRVNRIGWDDLSSAERGRISAARRELARHVGEIIIEAVRNECTFEDPDDLEGQEKQI